MGWYNDGNTFVRGDLRHVLPTWKAGDTLGMSLDFKKGVLLLYKDRKRVSSLIPLRAGDCYYAVMLMTLNARATLR